MSLDFENNKLCVAIAQHYETKEILMVAYMNAEAYQKTLDSQRAWFFSRSRNKLWLKGEESGNHLNVVTLSVDCDKDAILLQVLPEGPSCHTGNRSCFFTKVNVKKTNNILEKRTEDSFVLEKLASIIAEKAKNKPKDSYTSKLLDDGISRIAQKIIEESGEVALAGNNRDKNETIQEMADLLYHLVVFLKALDIPLNEVWKELGNRMEKK